MGSQYQLDEADRIAAWFGLAVKQRFEQRVKQFPQYPHALVVALAAADIWLVTTETDDPVKAVQEYFALEEAMR